MAEKSFAEGGASQKTKDAAYIASRRVAIADSRANTIAANNQKEQIIAQGHANTQSAS